MPSLSSVVAAVLVVSLSGCASARTPADVAPHLDGKVITDVMIADTPAETAWEVLEESGIFRMVSEYGGGRSSVRSRRGKTSVSLSNSDVPRLVVDGARVPDLRYLHSIPANSIAWIQILGGIQGTAQHGTNSGAGVIIVVSKTGL